MDKEKKNLLFAIWALCDQEDKSTEYMLALMCNESGLDYDDVVEFVCETSDEERQKWYKEEWVPFLKTEDEV